MSSKKEVEAMINRGSGERCIYSIKIISDSEKLWVLQNDGKYAASGDANKNYFFGHIADDRVRKNMRNE